MFKAFFRYLSAVLVLVVFSCCSRGPRTIPRSTMTRIYADMFMMDEQIRLQSSLSPLTDTTVVYAAIFEKYGYTTEDFLLTQEKYLKRAGHFVRVLKKSVGILTKEQRALKAEKDKIDAMLHVKDYLKRFTPENIYLLDSLGKDTTHLNFDFQKGMDTAYVGVRMIVWADTLIQARLDSLDRADSLAFADSVSHLDSFAAREAATRRATRIRNAKYLNLNYEKVKEDASL